MRPFQNPFAFRRKPMKSLAALDDRHSQFLLELADAAGERRLRDIASLGGPGEVLFPGESSQVDKLSYVHRTPIADQDPPEEGGGLPVALPLVVCLIICIFLMA